MMESDQLRCLISRPTLSRDQIFLVVGVIPKHEQTQILVGFEERQGNCHTLGTSEQML